ncbi:MAG: beta strand repeat-containing protein, partial [Acidimicrobiales bacterium]
NVSTDVTVPILFAGTTSTPAAGSPTYPLVIRASGGSPSLQQMIAWLNTGAGTAWSWDMSDASDIMIHKWSDSNPPLTILNSNLNIGIQNTAPAQALDVTGSINASTSIISPAITTSTTGTNLLLETGSGTAGAQITLNSGSAQTIAVNGPITTASTSTNLLLQTDNGTSGGKITIDASTPTTEIAGALTVSTTADITTSVTTAEVITPQITTGSPTTSLLLETGNSSNGPQLSIGTAFVIANPTTAPTISLNVSPGSIAAGNYWWVYIYGTGTFGQYTIASPISVMFQSSTTFNANVTIPIPTTTIKFVEVYRATSLSTTTPPLTEFFGIIVFNNIATPPSFTFVDNIGTPSTNNPPTVNTTTSINTITNNAETIIINSPTTNATLTTGATTQNLVLETGNSAFGGQLTINAGAQNVEIGQNITNPLNAPTFVGTNSGPYINPGTYAYEFTCVNNEGRETAPSPVSASIQITVSSSITISIPSGGFNTVSRNIYRSSPGPATPYGFVGSILNNSPIGFQDIAANIGYAPPTSNGTITQLIASQIINGNTTNGTLPITLDGNTGLTIDVSNFNSPGPPTSYYSGFNVIANQLKSNGSAIQIRDANIAAGTTGNGIWTIAFEPPTTTSISGNTYSSLMFSPYGNGGNNPLVLHGDGNVVIGNNLTIGTEVITSQITTGNTSTNLLLETGSGATGAQITLNSGSTQTIAVNGPITTASTGTNLVLETGNGTSGGQITIDAATATTAITGALTVSTTANITTSLIINGGNAISSYIEYSWPSLTVTGFTTATTTAGYGRQINNWITIIVGGVQGTTVSTALQSLSITGFTIPFPLVIGNYPETKIIAGINNNAASYVIASVVGNSSTTPNTLQININLLGGVDYAANAQAGFECFTITYFV